jgi:YVTN family beta-propeller protein
MRKPRFLATLPLLLAACAAPRASNEPPPDGLLVVLSKATASAAFIDLETGRTLRVAETGDGPHEAAANPDGTRVVVADYGGRQPGNTLTILEAPSGRRMHHIDLGQYTRPHGLSFLADGRLLVTSETQRALLVVDIASGAVIAAHPTDQPASHMVAATPDGSRAFVANITAGTLSAIDLETGALLGVIETGAGCEGVDVSPNGREVWTSNRAADTVSVVDTRTLEVRATIAVQGFPIRIQLTPDGDRALVSCARAGEVAVIDTDARNVTHRVPMAFNPARGADQHLFGDAFGESAVPIGIEIRPDGRVAYVANSAANQIAVFDLERMVVTGAFAAGEEPDGMAWIPK